MANETTLDKVVIEFDGKVNKFEDSIDALIDQVRDLREEFKDLSGNVEYAIDILEDIDEQTEETDKGMKSLSKSISSVRKTFAIFAGMTRTIMKFTEQSTNAVGVQTRFNAVFNNTKEELKEAQGWVEEYSSALYLDNIEVMDAASNFKLLAGNIGLTNEQANKMSKNLTMLSYDLMRVKTESDVSMAQTALASAMGGEAEAMKRYGVMLNQATLQQALYSLGIDRTVASLNAAEKAQLTYYHIMTTTAGQHGYYAKTLMSPANALNIIRTQFTLLARQIGNVFIPILMELLPVIIAITEVLKDLAQWLANIFNIDIDFDDVSSGIGNISTGIGGIGEEADKTADKVKNMTRDFDKLHVVNFDTGSGSGDGTGSGIGSSLGGLVDLAPYQEWNVELDKSREKVEKIKNFLEGASGFILAIVGVLAASKVSESIMSFFTVLSEIAKSGIFGAIAGITVAITAFESYLDNVEEGDIAGAILDALVAGAGTGFAVFSLTKKGGLAIAISAATTVAMILSFFVDEETKEKIGSVGKEITDAFKNWWETDPWGNTKILAYGGLIVAGLIAGMVAFVTGSPVAIATAIFSVFTAIVTAIKETFGIHSPAVKMEPFGENILLGLLEGIINVVTKIPEYIGQVASALFEEIKEMFENIGDYVSDYWDYIWEGGEKPKLKDYFEVETESKPEVYDRPQQINFEKYNELMKTYENLGMGNIFEKVAQNAGLIPPTFQDIIDKQKKLNSSTTISSDTYLKYANVIENGMSDTSKAWTKQLIEAKKSTEGTVETTKTMVQAVTSEYQAMEVATNASTNSFVENVRNGFSNMFTVGTESITSLKTSVIQNAKLLEQGGVSSVRKFVNDSLTNMKQMKTTGSGDMTTLTANTIATLQELQRSGNPEVAEFATASLNEIKNMTSMIKTDTDDMQKTTVSKFSDLTKKIKSTFDDATPSISKSIDKIKGLMNFNWQLPKIKLPKFSWTTTPIDKTSWAGKILSALNMPMSIPKLNLDWFANGGFPDTGSLFVANEREPELIGSWGNKSMVANSTQIIKGIESASYNGMKRALTEVPMSNETNVYVGNRQLTDVVTKQQRKNSNKYGR